MTTLRERLSLRGNSDEGSALIVVLAGMLVVFMVVSVTVGYALANYTLTRHIRDANRALAAAQAGVSDYLARLNQNDTYWQSTDCTNVALKRPWPTSPAACGWGSNTPVGWAPVTGSDGTEVYHYDVSTSSTYTDGSIQLQATGKSTGIGGHVSRTIQVTLRRTGFGEFLYYSVYETVDPANQAVYGLNNTTAQTKCAHYFWDPSTPRDTNYCADISFSTGDQINGPLHTNDAMLMSGTPKFLGTVTTSYPQCKATGTPPRNPAPTKCYRPGSVTPHPVFSKGIAYRDPINLPTSIGSLLQYVDPAQDSTPGCLYTGPTRIRIQGTKMQVWSPFSKTIPNAACGNAGAAWPQTVNVPQNNVILVQNVPAAQKTPASGACAAGSIGDGLPLANDYDQSLNEANCRYGTLYVQGNLTGKLTLAADNNIVITGDLTYDSGPNGTDTLGLIATNSVEMYHPVYCSMGNTRCSSSATDLNLPWSNSKLTNPTVDAAILTLQHSFTVQAYQYGTPSGNLNVFGCISQLYRGPVGTFNSGTGTSVTGYLKNYVYDTRLRYAPPPFFLDPTNSSWGQKTFGEIAPQYH